MRDNAADYENLVRNPRVQQIFAKLPPDDQEKLKALIIKHGLRVFKDALEQCIREEASRDGSR